MTTFECSGCGYSSPYKSNVKNHTRRRVKCTETEVLFVVEINAEVKCDYCSKDYKTKQNLSRHVKICRSKKEYLEKKLQEKDEENKKLKEELNIQKALASKPNITINNNVTLTPYMRPNLKDMNRFFEECARKQFMCIPRLIELIHFNENIPENHNLLLSNFRSDTMKAFNGNKWQTDEFEHIVNNLINTYERDLEEWAGQDPERLKHVKTWENIKKRDGEDTVYEDLKHEIRKLMYDNRYIVKYTLNSGQGGVEGTGGFWKNVN